MRLRRIASTAVLTCGLIAASTCFVGCPLQSGLDAIATRTGNAGFRNLALGSERIVSLEQGNLAEQTAGDTRQRLDILVQFLSQFGTEFGAGASVLKAGTLNFVATVPEEIVVFGEDEQHTFVLLQQEVDGAIVLDATQSGDFVRDPATEQDALRHVQGRLCDPVTVPPPPPDTRENRALAFERFKAFLDEQGVEDGDISLLDTPVIWVAGGIAGYLAVWTESEARIPDTAQGRLAVVVDPTTNEIAVLHRMDACRAGVSAEE